MFILNIFVTSVCHIRYSHSNCHTRYSGQIQLPNFTMRVGKNDFAKTEWNWQKNKITRKSVRLTRILFLLHSNISDERRHRKQRNTKMPKRRKKLFTLSLNSTERWERNGAEVKNSVCWTGLRSSIACTKFPLIRNFAKFYYLGFHENLTDFSQYFRQNVTI